jgi:hypothetical protein
LLQLLLLLQSEGRILRPWVVGGTQVLLWLQLLNRGLLRTVRCTNVLLLLLHHRLQRHRVVAARHLLGWLGLQWTVWRVQLLLLQVGHGSRLWPMGCHASTVTIGSTQP